jgi:hypothetical protein
MTFLEWCEANKLPISAGKKVPNTDARPKGVRDFKADLNDYKGYLAPNGTVEPYSMPGSKSKKK